MSRAAAAAKQALNITSTIKLANGQAIPAFGLGTWRSEKGKVREAVRVALEAGYRHLDCAYVYDNQDEVGQGLRDFLAAHKEAKREDVFITTKLWNFHHKPEDVEAECRDSLRQLGVDYIDLYLIHWPASFVFGHGFFPKDGNGKFMLLDVPLTATWKAMELLVDKKLVRAIGVSNFNEEEIKSILAVARIEPVVNQIEVHPHCPMHELAKFCADNGIVIMAYSPLGNVNPNEPNQVTPLRDPVIEAIAKAHRKSPAQVLIRYSLQRGFVCIPKSVTPDRIRENAAIFDFELTEQDMAAIHAIKTRKRHINPTFRPGGATIFPPDRF